MFAIKGPRRLDLRGNVSSSFTDEMIREFLSGLDCPRSLTVWLLYSNMEHDQLTELDCDPLQYDSVDAFRDSYLASCFLSKANFLETSFDRNKKALEKFSAAEHACGEVNKRFRDLAFDPLFKGPNVWLLNATTRKIASILGDYDLEEHLESCSWGPGATYSLRGDDTGPANKFRVCRGMTSGCYTLFNSIFPRAYPSWDRFLSTVLSGDSDADLSVSAVASRKWEIEPGNRVICVPKNSKTDRVIAAEPGVNLWFQLGIGRMITRRLYRNAGIDLSTQDRNQLLSFYGSLANNLATVDFSSASDTIASSIVRELIPEQWFDVMSSIRSVYGELPDGQTVRFEKFSSMGNGFTFPLQSLIFTAAALACCEYLRVDDSYVGVYGDDVVIPTDAYALFSEFCAFLGFTFNSSKSFCFGLFRESCGAHYFRGVDVKPIYLKERLNGYDSIFKLANGIRRLSNRAYHGLGCDRRYLRMWRKLFNKVPPPLRFVIPDGYGDGGFIGNFDEARPGTRRAGFWVEGYLVKQISFLPIYKSATDEALLLSKLHKPQTGIDYIAETPEEEVFYSDAHLPLRAIVHGTLLPDSVSGGNRESRRRATKRVISTLFVNEWRDLGGWY